MPKSKQLKEPQVWILVLGAGYGRRMGKQKLLLPLGKEPLINFVIHQALKVDQVGIVVVTNKEHPEVKESIEDLGITILENDKANAGMSTSLRMGIEYIEEKQAGAVMILLADQPGIDVSVLNQVIMAYRKSNHVIIQARYNGQPSHPVLFSSHLYKDLKTIEGDKGARNILVRKKESIYWLDIDNAVPQDIDTPNDYQQFLSKWEFKSE